jgi:hypothetical protein
MVATYYSKYLRDLHDVNYRLQRAGSAALTKTIYVEVIRRSRLAQGCRLERVVRWRYFIFLTPNVPNGVKIRTTAAFDLLFLILRA